MKIDNINLVNLITTKEALDIIIEFQQKRLESIAGHPELDNVDSLRFTRAIDMAIEALQNEYDCDVCETCQWDALYRTEKTIEEKSIQEFSDNIISVLEKNQMHDAYSDEELGFNKGIIAAIDYIKKKRSILLAVDNMEKKKDEEGN